MNTKIQDTYIPKNVFFTNGKGKHKDKLVSFELALRDAGIEKCNLVKVSSILPPNCKIISKEQGLTTIKPGQITFCVMAENYSKEPGQLISAAIGCAIPVEKTQFGYIGEYKSFDQNEKDAGKYAEYLATEMLASKIGIKFDWNASYDKKNKVFTIQNKLFKTQNIAKSVVCDKNGYWTAVIAAAIFVMF